MGEESSQLREVIQKKEQTIEEAAMSVTHFYSVTATGHDCLLEIQLKDKRKLDLLAQLLVLYRESLDEKDELLKRMDEADQSSDDEDQDRFGSFFCVLKYFFGFNLCYLNVNDIDVYIEIIYEWNN